jgi:hypothetical protein
MTKDKNKGIGGSFGFRSSLLIVDRVDDEAGFISEERGLVLIDGS